MCDSLIQEVFKQPTPDDLKKKESAGVSAQFGHHVGSAHSSDWLIRSQRLLDHLFFICLFR